MICPACRLVSGDEKLAESLRISEAHTVAALAAETIRSIADRAPEAGLRETFLAWTPVQTAPEDLERVRRM